MAPALGRSSAPSSCSSVVLPDPLGPSSATNSPASISRSTPSSARTVDGPRWKYFAAARTTYWFSISPPASVHRRVDAVERALEELGDGVAGCTGAPSVHLPQCIGESTPSSARWKSLATASRVVLVLHQ